MLLLSHEIRQFRNINALNLQPDPGINILYGNNGQGKTNIVESIWMFTGCHSFRSNKIRELIQEGQAQALLQGTFYAGEREQTVELRLQQKREA